MLRRRRAFGTLFGKRGAHEASMKTLRIPEAPLCMNCLHSGTCVFERDSPSPILHCAEHAVRPAKPAALQRATERPLPMPTGLCITCDHVRGCRLRSSERIVLHCEHYE